MYSFIRGVVADKSENSFVLDNGGIGYEIHASKAGIDRVDVGDEITVHIHEQVTESGINLVGFIDMKEKELFNKLIGINGVGVKAILTMFSNVDIDTINSIIAKGDAKELSKIKGVGPKTAERIVLELKGKVTASATPEQKTAVKKDNIIGGDGREIGTDVIDEVVSLLEGLGVAKGEALRLAKQQYEFGLTATDVLVRCLRHV
ncbi:MAG: Holliday junction branch migration protein RuvA [Christensenellaceae bacterium]|jgi:Holliday junction DNA helicase RuvA|nr:Holliday junction branch migration protein RuvA [Christensenellaceae bacterium]